MKPILVVNSGSSSLKYRLIDVAGGETLCEGLIDRVSDHSKAFEEMLAKLEGPAPLAVGHRVVHGGSIFSEPTLVTEEVLESIESLSPLAPLHNPGNVMGIRASVAAFPGIPQVAIFDTAFHQSMPQSSFRYAVPRDLEQKYQIRRYGFHGTSYAYVSKLTSTFLGTHPDELNAVILHLGNGASACAIRNGKSFDTSMGLTPLQGLVMGSRSGDIDPAVFSYLNRVGGYSVAEIDELLNRKSGLFGMTGVSDLRDIEELIASGHTEATEAMEVYVQRIKHYLGAYFAELGRVDAVVFTAGVGENSSHVRSLVLENLSSLGIEVDPQLNALKSAEPRLISTAESKPAVLVIPTNEELEIANQASRFC